MKLTKEEFCLFSLKSKIKLVHKDGCFLTRRISSDQFLISLYSIYDFYIEVVYDIPQLQTSRIDPIVNIQIVELYDFNSSLKERDIAFFSLP